MHKLTIPEGEIPASVKIVNEHLKKLDIEGEVFSTSNPAVVRCSKINENQVRHLCHKINESNKFPGEYKKASTYIAEATQRPYIVFD